MKHAAAVMLGLIVGLSVKMIGIAFLNYANAADSCQQFSEIAKSIAEKRDEGVSRRAMLERFRSGISDYRHREALLELTEYVYDADDESPNFIRSQVLHKCRSFKMRRVVL